MNRYIVSESDGFMDEKEILRCICILNRVLSCIEVNDYLKIPIDSVFCGNNISKVIHSLEAMVDV